MKELTDNMLDGKKDMNGWKKRKKIGKDNMRRKRPNFSQISWSTKMTITRVFTWPARHRLMKPTEKYNSAKMLTRILSHSLINNAGFV
jgi:hypothetical protein